MVSRRTREEGLPSMAVVSWNSLNSSSREGDSHFVSFKSSIILKLCPFYYSTVCLKAVTQAFLPILFNLLLPPISILSFSFSSIFSCSALLCTLLLNVYGPMQELYAAIEGLVPMRLKRRVSLWITSILEFLSWWCDSINFWLESLLLLLVSLALAKLFEAL